jgi:hypothetical protein
VHYVARALPHELDAKIHRHVGKVLRIEGDALGVTGVILAEKDVDVNDNGRGANGHASTTEGAVATATSTTSSAVTDGTTTSTADTTSSSAVSNDTKGAGKTAVTCTGVFILRPSVAPTTLLPTLELKDGYIAVDGAMRTNVQGVFAAGDCVGKPLQIAKAVGQGQSAVLSAVEYLDS